MLKNKLRQELESFLGIDDICEVIDNDARRVDDIEEKLDAVNEVLAQLVDTLFNKEIKRAEKVLKKIAKKNKKKKK